MTVGSILLATALLFLVGVYVFRPILAPARFAPPATQKETLLAQKDALLTEIKSLDFDFETGATSEESYQRERYKLVQQAAQILRQADQLPDTLGTVDEQIEAAIRALRGIGPAVTVVAEKSTSATCPKCSQPISTDDQFCRKCGEKLA